MSNHPHLSIAVLISGNGSNLQAIIDAIRHGLCAKISVVISNQENAYGLERASLAGIPTKILARRDFPDRNSYDIALAQCLDEYAPDLIVLAGFMHILSASFVAHFHNQILNIHPSLLPKYPGLNTHEKALAAGDTWHGVTVHVVTTEVDEGPIIAQASMMVAPNDDPASLKNKVHTLEHKLYPYVLSLFANGRITIENNHVLLDGEVLPSTGIIFTP
jgi:phosphoribosylglycinamide formyltransferase 1